MPFVPLGAAVKGTYPWEQITYSKGPYGWGKPSVSSGIARPTVGEAWAIRNSGRPSQMPWGWWKFSRPYSRTATVARVRGGPESLGNAPLPQNCTIMITAKGWPYSSPNNPLLTFPLTKGATNGLVDGGIAVLSANTRARLVTECMNKVGSRMASYGAAVAESRSTLNHLAKTVSTVLRAYKALRRGKLREFSKALGLDYRKVLTGKSASDRWLESQYAWLPLLGDIYDTHKVLNEGVQRTSQSISAVRQLQDGGVYKSGAITGLVSTGYRCKLHYRISSPTIDSLSRLGLTNPLEIAWELVPWSFVIDWMIPVGNVLQAWTSTMGLQFIDGCITTQARINASVPINNSYGLYYLPDSARFSIDYEHFGMSRSVVANATPSLYVKSPFSTNHMISALALLRSLQR